MRFELVERPVAPLSKRELHKDGGGGGGSVARRVRAARAPKAKSCATSCGTSSATPCAASFTCPSFMYHLRALISRGYVDPAGRLIDRNRDGAHEVGLNCRCEGFRSERRMRSDVMNVVAATSNERATAQQRHTADGGD